MWGITFVSVAKSSDAPSVWPTFWSATAALVAAAALLRTFLSIPAHRLIYVQKKPLSLAKAKLDGDDSASQQFKKLAEGLPNARIIEIMLAGRGRQDITKESFEDEAIIVEASSPIAAVLLRTSPEWYRALKAIVNGKRLEVGPGLIGKKHRLSYLLLIDEAEPKAALQSALTNVVVTRKDDYTGVLKRAFPWYFLWLFILGYLAFFAWLITWANWPDYAFDVAGVSMIIASYGAAILALISGRQAIKRNGVASYILVPEHTYPPAEDKGNAAPAKETSSMQVTPDKLHQSNL